jgi:hypothetical protein
MSEAQGMVAIEAALEPLDPKARFRVIAWAISRWAPELLMGAPTSLLEPVGFERPPTLTIGGFPVTSALPFDRVTRAHEPLEDGLLPRAGAFAVQTGDVNADRLAEDDQDGGVARLRNAETLLTRIVESATAESDPKVVAGAILLQSGSDMAVFLVQTYSSEVLCRTDDFFDVGRTPFIYTDEGKLFAQAVWSELAQLLHFHVEPPRQ